MEQAPTIWMIVSGLLAVVLYPFGARSLKRKRLLENVPTSKVKGVFMGLNEIKGRAHAEDPGHSYLAGKRCVYYHYTVAESWSRTVTYTDSKGRTQTRRESGWTTVDDGEYRHAFQLVDDTGSIRILPDRAEIQADTVFSETSMPGDGLYYAKGPSGAIPHSDFVRRFTEQAIVLRRSIYVMGAARLREDVVEPEIAYDREAELFLISTKSEEKLTSGYGLKAFFLFLFGMLGASLLPVGLHIDRLTFAQSFRKESALCILVGGCYAGAIALYFLLLVYNGLVSVRERLAMARSMIDVQLRRRHTLIPRLENCVKGIAAHERNVQERVAKLRTGGGDAAALKSILALAEAYPEIKADGNYAALQDELINTEDKIALAREFCNASVTALNNRIQTMPDSLVAWLTRFTVGDYFEAKGFERASVTVRF